MSAPVPESHYPPLTRCTTQVATRGRTPVAERPTEPGSLAVHEPRCPSLVAGGHAPCLCGIGGAR